MAEVNTYNVGHIVVNEVTVDIELASDELKAERMAICTPCENRVDDGCKECSCLLVNRIAFTESFCPVGKW